MCLLGAHKIRPKRSCLASTTSIQFNRTTASLCVGWWIDKAGPNYKACARAFSFESLWSAVDVLIFLCSVFLFPSPGTISFPHCQRLGPLVIHPASTSLNRKTHHGPFPLSKAGVLYFSVNVTLSMEHSQNLTWATISVMFNIHPEQSCHIFTMCVVGGLMKLWHSLRDGSCSGLLIHFALRAYDAFVFSSVSHRLSLFFPPVIQGPSLFVKLTLWSQLANPSWSIHLL